MAYIQKRVNAKGKVSFRARIRVQGHPDLSETFPTKRDANTWASRMEVDIRQGRYFPKDDSREKTFGQMIDRYIEKELPKKPKSFVKQSMQLNWWKKHLKDYFLCHITTGMISEIKEKLLEEMTYRKVLRSPSTANRYLAALSGVFSVASNEWGWIKDNPLSKVSRFKEGKARERFLTKEEIERLLCVCKHSKSPHLYTVTLFALSTGARRGEIMGLKWKDLDLERKTATFRDTKNGETRTIPLSRSLIECCVDEQQKKVQFSEFVFPNCNGVKPACIRTAWDNAVKEAELEGICFHSLRHTAASYLSMGGASTLEVGVILGHKTLAMVKRYSHLSVASTAKVLDKMNKEMLSGA